KLPLCVALPQSECYPSRVVASSEMLPTRPVGWRLHHWGGAMASKMTHEMPAEIADVIRRQYKAATGKKRRIFGEFIGTTGITRNRQSECSTPCLFRNAAVAEPSLSIRRSGSCRSHCGKRQIVFVASGCAHCCLSFCPRWNGTDRRI